MSFKLRSANSVTDTENKSVSEKAPFYRRVIAAAVTVLTLLAVLSELFLAIYSVLPALLLLGASYYPAENMTSDWMRIWLWGFPALMTTLLFTVLHIVLIKVMAKLWKHELRLVFFGKYGPSKNPAQ